MKVKVWVHLPQVIELEVDKPNHKKVRKALKKKLVTEGINAMECPAQRFHLLLCLLNDGEIIGNKEYPTDWDLDLPDNF